MRIVFVIWSMQNGGAQRAISLYANALAEMGEDVHIVCLRNVPDDYPVDERVKRHTLRLKRFFRAEHRTLNRLYYSFSIARQMQSILRTKQNCVVVPLCLEEIYTASIIFAAICAGARSVYPVRNNLQMRNKRWKKSYLLQALFSHGIWVQLEGQKSFFPRFMRRKAFTVHNILNDRFLGIQRTDRAEITRFINVGRVDSQKNQLMLINAFAGMVARTGNQTAVLTIYGKAREGSDIEEKILGLIRQLGMEDRILLPGRVTDIEARCEQADAFVFSSDYEGCPNALMEAMAAGLPCISTDCPTGPAELIEDGKSGLLVPVGDAEAMALAMQRMIENPQWANGLGAAAKERMRSWGGAREQAQRLLHSFERICS